MSTERFKLHASWDEVKEKLKENDVRLTDEDLEYEPGKEDELMERLQEKLHKPKQEIRMLIESISSNKPMAG
jgi:uncharacterized protein YjbJ (UPF0337 family)